MEETIGNPLVSLFMEFHLGWVNLIYVVLWQQKVFGQWEWAHSSQALAFLYRNRYQNYSQGEWQVARTLLSKTHGMLGEKDRGRPQLVGATGLVLKQRFPSLQDGPSGALLRFMETPYQFKAFGRHVVGKKNYRLDEL